MCEKTEWISVDYNLPEKGERVLVVDLMFGVQIGALNNNEVWMIYNGATVGSVTHWQPLPELPESK